MKGIRLAAIALACGLAGATACSNADRSVAPDPPCEQLRLDAPAAANVVLIVNDTMRRDRVGVYGGVARTPAFDAFARRNVYFANAFTNAPWTKPAVATLLTSLYPSQHGLTSHPELRDTMEVGSAGRILPPIDVLGDDYTTLAEVLRAAGMRTAAFVSNPWMAAPFGFGQGFEIYDDSFARWDAPGSLVSQRGLDWLATLAPGEPFFLYLHYIDSHRPYGALADDDIAAHLDALARDARPQVEESEALFGWLLSQPQQRLSKATRERLARLGPRIRFIELAYDRGIEAFDAALGLLLAALEQHPAYRRTAVIVTADHGEALFERGYGNHGNGLFDDEAAVPLAARLPGVRSEQPEVSCPISLVDLMPTLCTYLGRRCPPSVFGRSVLAADGAVRRDRYVVTEGVVLKPRHRSIRNMTYKLFWEPDGSPAEGPREYSMYDLVNDPAERHDLLRGPDVPPAVARAAGELGQQLRQAVPWFERPAAQSAPLDPGLERRLRSLGYLR